MDTQLGFGDKKLSASFLRSKLEDAETKINNNVPLFVFANHDNPRAINRYGDGVHNAQIARLLATLLLTPRDAALIYYGQEIGMVNHDPTRKEDVQDPIGKLGWPNEKGRDGERTPMQWNETKHAGFSTADETWLPVGSDYKTVNVVAEENDPNSLLNYYKKLIQLRRQNDQLRNGRFEIIDASNNSVLSFVRRTADGKAVLVALNLTGEAQSLQYKLGKAGQVVLASFENAPKMYSLNDVSLPAYGSLVLQVQ
jgi:alpha-glucosidase